MDLPPFSARVIDELEALNAGVFDSVAPQYVSWRMSSMPDVSAFLALAADKIVGFKMGYAMSQRNYYSWLGGVDPAFRRRGIASALMEQQHRWVVDARIHGDRDVRESGEHRDGAGESAARFLGVWLRVEAARTQVLYSKSLGAES